MDNSRNFDCSCITFEEIFYLMGGLIPHRSLFFLFFFVLQGDRPVNRPISIAFLICWQRLKFLFLVGFKNVPVSSHLIFGIGIRQGFLLTAERDVPFSLSG